MKLRTTVAASVGLLGLALSVALVGRGGGPDANDALVVASDPLLGTRPAVHKELPHVVLVLGCTVRKDQLAMYGGPAELGIHLQEFSREGALFTDAIAAAPWTKASATALLTGYHALQVGMTEPTASRNHRRLSADLTTMAEHLRDAGYRTVGATANPNLNAVFGFEQGFDAYVQLEKLWREDMQKLGAEELLPSLLRELDALPDDGRPRFVQVTLVDAHAPYEASSHDMARFDEPGLPRRVAAYRSALERFDHGFGQLESELARRGMTAENTLFFVVSDHGEGLNWPEHHGKAHGRFLAPSTVEAVWAARGPGIGRGVRIDGMASGVDLVPTLLGLLDLPGYRGPGHDHSRILATGGTTTREYAFTDTWFSDTDRAAVYARDWACQRDFSGTHSSDPFEEGCFERSTDPQHARPVRDEAREAVVVDWRRQMLETAGSREAEQVDPSADIGAQLEALGYLE